MHLEPLTGITLGNVERAHASLNAAFTAIAVDRTDTTLDVDIELARGYLHEARDEVSPLRAGAGGRGDAFAAARAVLPRLDHALLLLDALQVSRDQAHVTPLLDELGIALDHVEATLAAAGWE